MVTITKREVRSPAQRLGFQLGFFALLGFLFYGIVQLFDFIQDPIVTSSSSSSTRNRIFSADKKDPHYQRVFVEEEGGAEAEDSEAKAETPKKDAPEKSASTLAACPYQSLQDLTPDERHPKASKERHIADPPHDTKVTLVCCQTTKGPWNIAVHHAWAPRGAQRFLDMVRSQYFNAEHYAAQGGGVPLMRCVSNFLCQFGLAGERSKQFQDSLPDDPQWLPMGPDHRSNKLGVKRFQKGYFSYAGGGPNTRDNQLFVTLHDNGPLGGGSPWEVPWGELVGSHSYQTLDQIYTGYGEDGPTQNLLWQKGSLEKVNVDFPKLDWILFCDVVDEVDEGGAAVAAA